MGKLKEDWQIATRREKIKFATVILWEFAIGCYAIYLAVQFALSAARKETDYWLLAPIAILIVVMWMIARIPLTPKGAL